jgi:DUF1009 family protein
MGPDQKTPPSPLGLIAGNGRFPFLVARAARRGGRSVVAIAVQEEASPDLATEVEEFHWVGLGQLGRCISLLRAANVCEAVMAGQIKHRQLFSGIVPDLKLLGLLARLATRNTDSLIGAVADTLAEAGIRLLSSTELLTDELATAGAMTRRKPSSSEQKDIAYGERIARTIAGLDLGQAVAVKEQAVVAIEAMEGTDEVIHRAGRLAGKGVTVVKVSKPSQDMRFDVPVIGTGTLATMEEVGAGVLAIDSGRTLMIDRPVLLARADELGMAIWGLEPSATA